MTRRPTTREMSDAHEIFLAELFDGRRAVGSGNQAKDQMDGRNRRYDQEHCLAWDGKSSFAKSIGVSHDMWGKAVEQSHGEKPLIALRFYDPHVGHRLRSLLDLIVLDAHDFVEILADARAYRREKMPT